MLIHDFGQRAQLRTLFPITSNSRKDQLAISITKDWIIPLSGCRTIVHNSRRVEFNRLLSVVTC